MKRADAVPYRLLEPVAELRGGDPAAANMLVQGDNLDALKALLPYFSGRVKCAYIDPPYNTRSAFEHYDDNLEHSQWLSTMYPRLSLLRELLSDDGSIWISLDDHEFHYLKVIMDEIFGRSNFVTTVIWQMVYTTKNSARHFSDMHDYVLVYAKNKDKFEVNLLPRAEKQDLAYKNPDNDPRGPWKATPLHARNFYAAGQYTITSPGGREISPPSGTYWRISEENYLRMNSENRVWWGRDGSAVPAQKRFLTDVKQGVVPATLWLHSDAGHNAEAKNEVRAIFDEHSETFLTPKPERLIERVLRIATRPGDIVLDSFLGSGTTAAVAQKLSRRWIGIEMGDHAVTHCVPRLRKVIDGEQGGISEAAGWSGGGGFEFYRLGEPVFDETGALQPGIPYQYLAAHIWFSEFGRASAQAPNGPYLGNDDERGLALLYNGVLGDKRPDGGNVLTSATLRIVREAAAGFDGPLTIYGEASRLGAERLRAERVTFKQTPYEVRTR